MSTVERPGKILVCRMCRRKRLVGTHGWYEGEEFLRRYEKNPRLKYGAVIDEDQYCDAHSADLHVEEHFHRDEPPEHE